MFLLVAACLSNSLLHLRDGCCCTPQQQPAAPQGRMLLHVSVTACCTSGTDVAACLSNSLLHLRDGCCCMPQQQPAAPQGRMLLHASVTACCTSGTDVAACLSNSPLHLRDGPAQTIVRAATLREKLQIKLGISSSHSTPTGGQPVPMLTLECQTPGRVAIGQGYDRTRQKIHCGCGIQTQVCRSLGRSLTTRPTST